MGPSDYKPEIVSVSLSLPLDGPFLGERMDKKKKKERRLEDKLAKVEAERDRLLLLLGRWRMFHGKCVISTNETDYACDLCIQTENALGGKHDEDP